MSYKSVPSSYSSWIEEEIWRASSRLGCKPSELAWMANDWLGNEYLTTSVTNATISFPTSATNAGIVRIVTNATTSAQGFLRIGASSMAPPFIPVGVNGEWYISTYQSITVGGSGQYNYLGVSNALETMSIGVRAASSTTKFVAAFANGTATSTVDIDTSWRKHRVWRTGGTTSYSIDDGTAATSANAYPSGAYSLCVFAQNNASDATSNTIENDWVFTAFVRP